MCLRPWAASAVAIFSHLVGCFLLKPFRSQIIDHWYIKLAYLNVLDTSDGVRIWCLKEKKSSDIMELDVILSAFEKTLLEYK